MTVIFAPKKYPPFISSIVATLKHRIRRDLQFSGIFACDFFASLAHAGAAVYLLQVRKLPVNVLLQMAALVALFLLLHAAKIAMVIFLEKKGGDAREFIGSDHLVTAGVYLFSRNPAYLISIAQSVVWSLMLLRGALAEQPEPVSIVIALIVPILHFLSIDHLIIPREEAALRRAHPQEFADYAARVNRWFGWRRAAA
jgi:protein-S-isoprenylcysteine O-methyltransferase Ste14